MTKILINLDLIQGALSLCDEMINQIESPDELSMDIIHQYGSVLALANSSLKETITQLEQVHHTQF